MHIIIYFILFCFWSMTLIYMIFIMHIQLLASEDGLVHYVDLESGCLLPS